MRHLIRFPDSLGSLKSDPVFVGSFVTLIAVQDSSHKIRETTNVVQLGLT